MTLSHRADVVGIVVSLLLLAGAMVALAYLRDECAQKHCPPGLQPELMRKHKNVYKCVCVGVAE